MTVFQLVRSDSFLCCVTRENLLFAPSTLLYLEKYLPVFTVINFCLLYFQVAMLRDFHLSFHSLQWNRLKGFNLNLVPLSLIWMYTNYKACATLTGAHLNLLSHGFI